MKLKKIYLSTPLAILSSFLPSCTIVKKTNYEINNQFKDVFSKFYNSYMYYGLLAKNSNVAEWKDILEKYYVFGKNYTFQELYERKYKNEYTLEQFKQLLRVKYRFLFDKNTIEEFDEAFLRYSHDARYYQLIEGIQAIYSYSKYKNIFDLDYWKNFPEIQEKIKLMNKKYDEDFFRTKFLVFMNFTYFQDLSNVNEQLVNEISINKIGYSNKNKVLNINIDSTYKIKNNSYDSSAKKYKKYFQLFEIDKIESNIYRPAIHLNINVKNWNIYEKWSKKYDTYWFDFFKDLY